MKNKFGLFGRIGTIEAVGLILVAHYVWANGAMYELQTGVGVLLLKDGIKIFLSAVIWTLEGIFNVKYTDDV